MSPRCAKKGEEMCSCGDTGCDGPNAVINNHSSSSSSSAPLAVPKDHVMPDPPPPRNKLKHPIHVPGDGKHQPPVQSLLAKKLAVVDVQLDLEEKKSPATAVPTEEKRPAAARAIRPSQLLFLRRRKRR